MVSILALYYMDLCSKPAEVCKLSVKIVVVKNETKHKETVIGPLLKEIIIIKMFFQDWEGLALNCKPFST